MFDIHASLFLLCRPSSLRERESELILGGRTASADKMIMRAVEDEPVLIHELTHNPSHDYVCLWHLACIDRRPLVIVPSVNLLNLLILGWTAEIIRRPNYGHSRCGAGANI